MSYYIISTKGLSANALKTAAFRQQMKAMHLRSHLPANHRLQAVDIKEDVMGKESFLQLLEGKHSRLLRSAGVCAALRARHSPWVYN